MDYKPRQSYKGSSYTYKKKRIFWFNSAFNDDFTLVDGKIDDITFNVPPFQTYKNNNLKLLTFVREDANAKPIIIKLKEPYLTSRSVINTDKENYPIIYANHTGCEGMTSKGNNFDLTPQQIPKFVFKFDDTINKLTYNSYFSSVVNGSLSQVAGGSPEEKILIFNSSGSFVLSRNLTCDILIVGGGGGGGFFGAGGGAGQVLYTTNLNLSLGSYTITVGSGGAGSSTSSSNGTNGGDSSITIGGITYTAKGGGGGGTRQANSVGRAGNDGGSGGGASHSDSSTAINVGGSSTKNDYSNWISLGNSGGDGKDGNDGGYGHGGGGGAGSKGSNGLTNGGGNGGMGINLSSIFGSSIGQAGWFSGGGGGTAFSGVAGATFGFANGGNGLFGGGGNGSIGYVNGINGLANTGGGGGGSDIYAIGGNGGSGVVIIKFRETRINGITAGETLVQATNSSIAVVENSKYQINYQNPINIPTGTYETIFSNGGITFKSKPDYTYPTTSKSPIIWYKFDGSQFLYDSSGNNNLTTTGAVLDTNNFIRGNGSLSVSQNKVGKISGSNINLYSIQTSNGLSFSVWFRATFASQYGRVFEFVNNAPPENYSVIMDFPNSPTTNNLRIYIFNTPTYVNYTTSGINFCDGNWRHIVWTISSSGVWSFYINGVNQNINITGNVANSLDLNYHRVLGGSFDGSVSYITGNIDDFRVFDYVLSPYEVYDLYNGNTDRSYPILKDANGATINPLVWYKFDSDGITADASGNGYTLTNGSATLDNSVFIKGGSSLNIALGNYVEITNSIDFRTIQITNGISFSLWVKMSSATGLYGRLFDFSGSGTIAIHRDTGGNNLYFLIYANTYLTSGTNYFNDTWYHIVWSISSSGVWNIYVNGVSLSVSITYSIPSGQTFNSVKRIGRGLDINPADRSVGKFDDFRIYQTTLSATQVSELYNGRVAIYNPPNFEIGLEMNDVDLVPDNTISPYL